MAASPELPLTDMLIMQPTAFCNVDCDYCYLPDRTDKRRMSREVLEAAFSKLLPSRLVGGRLAVVWHAGEPLVVPPDWYEDAIALAEAHKPPGGLIDHAFQSNGTLVDARWVEFFKRTGSRISLSIDGPAWLHDRRRRTRAGQGTHARAMRGLRLLQAAGIAPAVITVLTSDSLGCADALFDFYAEHGISDVAFNVEELEGTHVASSMAGASAEEAYRGFMRRFMARLRAAPEAMTLREWRDATEVLRFGVADGFNQEAEPLRIVSVARDGAVSTFSPELLGFRDERYDDFIFGNILVDPVETIIARVLSSRLQREIRSGLENCRRTCGWFAWCGGGSPSNKIFETGDPSATETAYCRLTRQTLLDAVLSTLEEERLFAATR